MRKRTSKLLRNWLKDTGLGALVFLMLPLLTTGLTHPFKTPSFDDVFAGEVMVAGEVMATRAVEGASAAGTDAETAIAAIAQLRPAAILKETQRQRDLIVLGLTFSLLMGCNLAFWRHLRRVSRAERRTSRGTRP